MYTPECVVLVSVVLTDRATDRPDGRWELEMLKCCNGCLGRVVVTAHGDRTHNFCGPCWQVCAVLFVRGTWALFFHSAPVASVLS